MEQLLTTKASIDTHHRKQVSDIKTAFHQDKAQTAEAIKQAGAHCTTAIREAEAMHAAAIREAEACCVTAIREAQTTCAAAIREGEAACVDHADTLQQLQSDSMQGIEREAIEE